MKRFIFDQIPELLEMMTDALFSPIHKWHEDELRSRLIGQSEQYSHEERMALINVLGTMVLREELSSEDKYFIISVAQSILSVDNQVPLLELE